MAKEWLGEFNSSSNTENSLNSIISCHRVKFFFSLRKHWQKTFVTLSGLRPLSGWGGLWVNQLKKENSWQKPCFHMSYETLKISEKWYLLIKSNKKQWLHLTNYYKMYLQNFNYNVFFIWFWMVFRTSWFCLLRAEGWGGGGGLLNWQNPLSMRKFICRQSL